MVEEVRRQEEGERHVKAVSIVKQGRCTNWEGLEKKKDWKLEVDLHKKLVFPPEIEATTLRQDLVLWSPTTKLAYVVELTVPWVDGCEEAYERGKKTNILTWQLKHPRTAGR